MKIKLIVVAVFIFLTGCGVGVLYDRNSLSKEIQTTFKNGFERQTYPINGEVTFGTDGNDTVTIEIKGLVAP